MNAFTVAATALVALLAPLALVAALRRPVDGLVALELAAALATLALVCLGVGLHSSVYFGVAVICALLGWVGGLVYARFLGRWL
ncbi:MAG TPA: monovalent cation/H+ antiporter complex subunit F [Gaiellaceae bacterium]|nr:monovalent cation/H+ antiporter complex subunit F [Gaiellaceae bacterium]